jgi:hypothetical protein
MQQHEWPTGLCNTSVSILEHRSQSLAALLQPGVSSMLHAILPHAVRSVCTPSSRQICFCICCNTRIRTWCLPRYACMMHYYHDTSYELDPRSKHTLTLPRKDNEIDWITLNLPLMTRPKARFLKCWLWLTNAQSCGPLCRGAMISPTSLRTVRW